LHASSRHWPAVIIFKPAYVHGYSIESASHKSTTVLLVSSWAQKPQPLQNGER